MSDVSQMSGMQETHIRGRKANQIHLSSYLLSCMQRLQEKHGVEK
jgi:hypothetical protein